MFRTEQNRKPGHCRMKTASRNFTLVVFLLITIGSVFAQEQHLQKAIEQLAKEKQAKVGVAVRVIETGEETGFNADARYPMQSVYKFPLALAVLHAVDSKHFSLDSQVHITQKDLHPDTWSPLRDKYPEGETDITVAELLAYSVSKSDNNACDILFRLIGGTTVANQFISQLGISGIEIVSTEEEMAGDSRLQYRNFATPMGMNTLLERFFRQKILSPGSNAFLLKLMTETENSPKRIKAYLPQSAEVAHKTGSSGANGNGLYPATNDVGIVTFPDGRHLAISVFVSDSRESADVNESIIADIALLAWIYYVR